jgi:hypothetical protein
VFVLRDVNNKYLIIGSVTLLSAQTQLEKMRDYLTLLHSFTGKFIIGDFNSKNTYWGSRLTNAKGSELYQAIRENHCEVHTT